MKTQVRHKRLRVVAFIIVLIVSLNAIAAGYSFIVEPSGEGVGITTGYLRESAPFRDYQVPGIILFSVIGIGGLFVSMMTMKRQSKYPVLLIAHGCILVGWISVQLSMVKTFHILHVIISVAGIALVAIGWRLKQPAGSRFRVFASHEGN